MSSCFPRGGGTRTYGLESTVLSKSPSISSSIRSPASSSSSSTAFSDASTTTTLTITSKKQRAPRKRPNQVYAEATALLSTVYPHVFSGHNLKRPPQRAKSQNFEDETPELMEEPLRFMSAETQVLIFRPPISGHEAGLLPASGSLCIDDKTNSTVEIRSHNEEFSDSEVSVLRPPASSDSEGCRPGCEASGSDDETRLGIEIQSRRDDLSDSEVLASPVGCGKETEHSVSENGVHLGAGYQSGMDDTEHVFQQPPVSGDANQSGSYNKSDSAIENQSRIDEFSEEEYVISGSPVPSHDIESPESNEPFDEEFEAGSLLQGEVDKGIDSILGSKTSDDNYDRNPNQEDYSYSSVVNTGLPTIGMDLWALRRDRDRAPAMEVLEFMPRLRLVDKIMAQEEQSSMAFCSFEWVKKEENSQSGLSLKLNYDRVLNEWSDRGPAYAAAGANQGAEECLPSSSSPDSFARLMQYDVFPDMGLWRQAGEDGAGIREASVLRYKEKRRTRLFSKKIRYEVRKVNADKRPRMKGRFVRRPSLLHS
ncbi:CHLOROPLAST IMPORT APPARATUS 2 protein [Nymphaea thermarum]|nr:CHLOROPLAST IMPORT APPARATUS 2 protein [Nymphaea thermarum]